MAAKARGYKASAAACKKPAYVELAHNMSRINRGLGAAFGRPLWWVHG
ncbi:MAG TPA: hypothetical protein VJT16_00950 [Streptosporangiaceae bacterium]|jgi:hypothetical protein|nr:hypothetical protein [Streptosporangiaceae bacterium]